MTSTPPPRLLAALPPPGAARATFRGRPWAELIDTIDQAGLRGRGGAGFPTAVKMRSVAQGRGRAVVLANGTEGEPASYKDRLLLTGQPHLVLDGPQNRR